MLLQNTTSGQNRVNIDIVENCQLELKNCSRELSVTLSVTTENLVGQTKIQEQIIIFNDKLGIRKCRYLAKTV